MRTFRIFDVRPTYPVDFVSNNTVDKDVQSMLLPLNVMQNVMLCPKFIIKNNRINPNNVTIKIASMIGTFVFICSFGYRSFTMQYYTNFGDTTNDMYIASFLDFVIYCSGFAMNFFFSVIQTKNSIKFVLTFQKIHRFLNDEISFNRLIFWNWIFTIVVLFGFTSIFMFLIVQMDIPFYFIYVCYIVTSFDCNIVYTVRVVKSLENKLFLWNIEVVNPREIEEDENYGKKMLQAYICLMDCYDIIKVGFQHFILYYIVETSIHSLIYIDLTIVSMKLAGTTSNSITMDEALMNTFSVSIWLIKNLIWLTILCWQCEKFYLAIERIQDSCRIIILESKCSDDVKKLCKNVLRLHRASFSKLRVCGLFYLDAALQLSLMSHLTNYTVVLLQFAFL